MQKNKNMAHFLLFHLVEIEALSIYFVSLSVIFTPYKIVLVTLFNLVKLGLQQIIGGLFVDSIEIDCTSKQKD